MDYITDFFTSILRWLLRIFFLILFLAIVGIVLLFTVDLNMFKNQIQSYANAHMNIKVDFDSFSFSILKGFSLELKNLSIEDKNQKSSLNIFMTATSAVLKCDLFPLLTLTCKGTVDIQDPNILLISTGKNTRKSSSAINAGSSPAEASEYVFFPFKEMHIKPINLKNTEISFITMQTGKQQTYYKIENRNLYATMNLTSNSFNLNDINMSPGSSYLSLRFDTSAQPVKVSGNFSGEKLRVDNVVRFLRPAIKKTKVNENIDIEMEFNSTGADFASLSGKLNATGTFHLFAGKRAIANLITIAKKNFNATAQTSLFSGLKINENSVISELKRLQKKSAKGKVGASSEGSFRVENGTLFLRKPSQY